MHRPIRRRFVTTGNVRLRLERLEAREVPAGQIQAALTAGVLTLTGDDDSNVVTLKVTSTDITLTPDGATAINGQAAGTPVTLTGAATTLKAALKSGADSLVIDAAADLILPGGAKVDLGDGDNTLNFTTDGKIELRSLSVGGGDGTDTVTVDAGTGLGKVNGPATFDGRLGLIFLTLQDIQLPRSAGVMIKGVGGRYGSSLTLSNVTAAGVVSMGVQDAGFFCMVTDSTFGRLNIATSKGLQLFFLTRTAVTGDIVVGGVGRASINATQCAIGGNVTMSGFATGFVANDVTVSGNVTTTGIEGGGVAADGPFSARNVVATTATGAASFSANGATTTVHIAGNLTVFGPAGAGVSFNTGAQSEVQGNVTLTGGRFIDHFGASFRLRIGGNLTINLAGEDNTVGMGGSGFPVEVGGNLTIRTGDGNDTISLRFVNILGATVITTGSGADTLNVENGANFAGTFFANLGNGDDLIALGQSAGASRPVEFTAKATILAGTGNDTLQLGNSTITGDANSLVRFVAAGNKIDGGLGLNWFDDETQQFVVGPTGTLALLGWTDPTP
jgi:hypothetical protein